MLKKGSPVGKSKSVWESPNFIESISPTYKLPFDGVGLDRVGMLTLSKPRSDEEVKRDLPKSFPLSPGQLHLLFAVQLSLDEESDTHRLLDGKKCNLLYMPNKEGLIYSVKIDQALILTWRKEVFLPGSQIWPAGTRVFFNTGTRPKV
jgi:hypothetical protein